MPVAMIERWSRDGGKKKGGRFIYVTISALGLCNLVEEIAFHI